MVEVIKKKFSRNINRTKQLTIKFSTGLNQKSSKLRRDLFPIDINKFEPVVDSASTAEWKLTPTDLSPADWHVMGKDFVQYHLACGIVSGGGNPTILSGLIEFIQDGETIEPIPETQIRVEGIEATFLITLELE